jgi:cellulose synthase/poly-beta-1,6-N-acetylglucosamine synthase-like glycosyltransferase
MEILGLFFTVIVLSATIPLFSSLLQFSFAGLHGIFNHYKKTEHFTPNVAIVLPAWNEGDVIAASIDLLMKMDYPKDNFKIYIVDDASTDHTPRIAKEKEEEFLGNVYHLRREKGGEGKAHTLNHGLRIIFSQPWAEAVLIMDADVLFEKDALRKMTRHLIDPNIGSVTAYIKEGSFPGNLITRFIAFEYITAQAVSRRAQNVLGQLACLAGGAQLHSRENMLAIGGVIDTSSLAEDTFTTFKTQLGGRRAIFDGNAIVWAEEPDTLKGVWKQRLRWARGNIQVTKAFKHLWLNKMEHRQLGSFTFSFLWFSIMMMPFFMIGASIGLCALFFVDFKLSWVTFRLLWILNVIVYLFVTLFSFTVDTESAKRSWVQGIVFPGIISLTIIILSVIPNYLDNLVAEALLSNNARSLTAFIYGFVLFIYMWLALCMLCAWGAYRAEMAGMPTLLINIMALISGFGPLLCAITFASYISEWQGASLTWDKTEKKGNVKVLK